MTEAQMRHRLGKLCFNLRKYRSKAPNMKGKYYITSERFETCTKPLTLKQVHEFLRMETDND
jgi:hypothetical protein